jgi:hypothetical protein
MSLPPVGQCCSLWFMSGALPTPVRDAMGHTERSNRQGKGNMIALGLGVVAGVRIGVRVICSNGPFIPPRSGLYRWLIYVLRV